MINDKDLSCLNSEDECALGLDTGRLGHEQSVLVGHVVAVVGLHPERVDDKQVLA